MNATEINPIDEARVRLEELELLRPSLPSPKRAALDPERRATLKQGRREELEEELIDHGYVEQIEAELIKTCPDEKLLGQLTELQQSLAEAQAIIDDGPSRKEVTLGLAEARRERLLILNSAASTFGQEGERWRRLSRVGNVEIGIVDGHEEIRPGVDAINSHLQERNEKLQCLEAREAELSQAERWAAQDTADIKALRLLAIEL